MVPVIGQLVGAVAGIVFMARSKIGPALALWATCFLAFSIWSGVGTLVFITGAASDSESASVVLPREAPFEEDEESAPPSDAAADSPDAVPDPESEALAGSGDEPNSSGGDLKACGNLRVEADTTTCPFAQNVFWEYWNAFNNERSAATISAYSEALGEWLEVTCDEASTVVCATDAGSEVQISQDALDGYTQEMADEYAESHTVSGE